MIALLNKYTDKNFQATAAQKSIISQNYFFKATYFFPNCVRKLL